MAVPLTIARSGLARSGDARSGYPIVIGKRALLYALSGVARSNATRSNYHSSKVFINIGGAPIAIGGTGLGPGVLIDSLTIQDTLNATPNTARCRTYGLVPTVGQSVRITLGSINNATYLFAGQVLAVDQGYLGIPKNAVHDLAMIDATWGLSRHKVMERYTSTTVGAIATNLIAKYAPGYTVAVAADISALPINEITFTVQDLPGALSQLTARVGGNWRCDYHAVVRLFLEDKVDPPPTPITTVHQSFTAFRSTRDLSQIVTRVGVEGGGVNAFATLAPGETILPLEGDAGWYPATGGVVKCGPQFLIYLSVQPASGGGLVGPGAAPSGAPVLALASGIGIQSGVHQYAVTFVTPSGESIAGSLASITTGLLAGPLTAPTAGTPTIGTGPNPGSHDYAVTFITATGETTEGPRVTRATTLTPEPVSAPIPGVPTAGAGVTFGNHDYAVTFVTAIGETAPGPIGGQVSVGSLPGPASAPTADGYAGGPGPEVGSHDYAVTFVTAAGETTPGPRLTMPPGYVTPPTILPTGTAIPDGFQGLGPSVTPGNHWYTVTFLTPDGETTACPIPPTQPPLIGPAMPTPTKTPQVQASPSSGGNLVNGGKYRWKFSYTDAVGHETALSPASNLLTATSTRSAEILNFNSQDEGVYRINVYRTTNNGSIYYLEFENEFTTNFNSLLVGVLSDAQLVTKRQPMAPSVVPAMTSNSLSVPLGPTGTTGRKLYRDVADGPTMKLLATINDNTTTSYLDTTFDYALGSTTPPATNTAALRVKKLAAIPTGPSGVTDRRIYRTLVGGSTMWLLDTIANNSTTTFTDNIADSIATPGACVAALAGTGAGNVNLGTHNYRVTFVTDHGETDGGPPVSVNVPSPATNGKVNLSSLPVSASLSVTKRRIYRTVANGVAHLGLLLATINDNTTTTYLDNIGDASLGAAIPTANTAGLSQNIPAPASGTAAAGVVPLTAIPTGAGGSGVTSRNLYRRSGGVGLRFLATLANNSTTTFSDTVPNASLGAAPPTVNTAHLQRIALTDIPKGGPLVLSRNLYRTVANGAQLKLLAILADNTTTTFADTVTDASLGVNVPVVGTATANQVSLTSIPIGAAAVTARKVYRTAANSAQLKLLTTLAGNITSTYMDSTPDASLGASPPINDTSGLTQPQGNVLAGSTSLQIASIGPFPPAGWAVIGNGQQVIRYTGISGNVLTGIPASGPGAIAATISYNSTVTAAPQLMGIPAAGTGAIKYPILKGDEVNLWMQVDDLAAQSALAALIGGDGIQEDTLQDRRLSATECLARGKAHLALHGAVAVGLRYACRDLNTRAGQTVFVNLGPPTNVYGDFLIQEVTISKFHPLALVMPTHTVTASSTRFSFLDFLRLARQEGDK